VALTEQKQYLPEIALIPQMTVPTGSREVSAGRVLPGLNVDSTWKIIKDFFSIELLVAANRVPDGPNLAHVEFATGLTGVVNITGQLETFVEWDAFYPLGVTDPMIGQRHYGVGGLVYFVTNNLAIDIRAGAGLNKQANDFLVGVGFAVRIEHGKVGCDTCGTRLSMTGVPVGRRRKGARHCRAAGLGPRASGGRALALPSRSSTSCCWRLPGGASALERHGHDPRMALRVGRPGPRDGPGLLWVRIAFSDLLTGRPLAPPTCYKYCPVVTTFSTSRGFSLDSPVMGLT
jgi:outer membrane putative beta-barrel porin/alpha-amylase